MCLISFDVGHVVASVCVGTLVALMVAVISTCVTIKKIVESFQDVAMRAFVASASSATATASSSAAASAAISATSTIIASSSLVWIVWLLLWLLIRVGALPPLLALFSCCAATPFVCPLVGVVGYLVCMLSTVLLGWGHIYCWRDCCCLLMGCKIRCVLCVVSHLWWRCLASHLELREPRFEIANFALRRCSPFRIAENASPYPSWPNVVPLPSVSSFLYSVM